MSRPIIYIDGQEGSTGLRIRALLKDRKDINLILIPPEKRREPKQRASHLNEADLAILCLPDTAAVEALEMINPHTRVIDTSTERRTQEDWTYGLPELGPSHRQTIATSDRVANPGCYPVGFILTVRPLIESGILPATTPLTRPRYYPVVKIGQPRDRSKIVNSTHNIKKKQSSFGSHSP